MEKNVLPRQVTRKKKTYYPDRHNMEQIKVYTICLLGASVNIERTKGLSLE